MQYEDELVGSIMNKDFISFNLNITVDDTIDLLREVKPDEEVIHYIYIVDEKEKLQGVVTLRDLVLATADMKIKDLMNKDIIYIKDSDNIEDAIELMVKYDLLSLPVLSGNGKLCGIIIMNDLVQDIFMPVWKKRFKKVG